MFIACPRAAGERFVTALTVPSLLKNYSYLCYSVSPTRLTILKYGDGKKKQRTFLFRSLWNMHNEITAASLLSYGMVNNCFYIRPGCILGGRDLSVGTRAKNNLESAFHHHSVNAHTKFGTCIQHSIYFCTDFATDAQNNERRKKHAVG